MGSLNRCSWPPHLCLWLDHLTSAWEFRLLYLFYLFRSSSSYSSYRFLTAIVICFWL
ncbi:hypothetical protein V6Z12_A01G106700 [Gossypium hirsutum]